ncbi:MAG: glycyl-radical enzyme activating protein [Evtepia sp.]|uniref:glycyl-radical enzyme activating protein n=1 Tax=Evtepia sp. TaxID=2773933 RepID=UPI002A75144E|nr:glycyl-radical enzyme activating protein [Evtepia sp.]MDY3014490.1 glycyl-radical enzyme activating protein [Evtepia sp.]
MEKTATIFDIGRFRNTDGPGIRTILFFKGCPLSCRWCSNPFGLSPKPQLVVNPVKCTGCGTCAEVCGQGVNQVTAGEKVQVDFDHCTLCGACVDHCPAGTRMISGKEYTARELFREANKDAAFYRKGGGGVTISGGEALLQYEVAAETLRLCRSNYLNTCLETSAYAPWDHLWQVARYCHTVFVDLKHMDEKKHREQTGVSNRLILENIRKLCQELPKVGGKVIVRVPLIPGYNDDDETVKEAAQFVDSLSGCPELNLLPYHNLGESKYEMIGKTYAMGEVESRKTRDPRLLQIQRLCQTWAPENRVSLGGDAIALE